MDLFYYYRTAVNGQGLCHDLCVGKSTQVKTIFYINYRRDEAFACPWVNYHVVVVWHSVVGVCTQGKLEELFGATIFTSVFNWWGAGILLYLDIEEVVMTL